jgi:hypothetical protein
MVPSRLTVTVAAAYDGTIAQAHERIGLVNATSEISCAAAA